MRKHLAAADDDLEAESVRCDSCAQRCTHTRQFLKTGLLNSYTSGLARTAQANKNRQLTRPCARAHVLV